MEDQTKQTLKDWIALDDEERQFKSKISEIKAKKLQLSSQILTFMKTNSIDNIEIQGEGLGNLSRSTRTSRPPLKRDYIRTQLLLHFADQPLKISEALRAIEGIPEGQEDMSVGGKQREMLTRRIPKKKTSVVM